MATANHLRRALPWLILGPLLVVSGAFLGRLYPGLVGREPPMPWQEPAPVPVEPRLPSLAPLLDAVRSGVVAITTLRRRDGEADLVGSPEGQEIQGTGFVVHEEGLVVTSHHVVAGYDRIRVDLADHRSFAAEVVGEDLVSDLAVLRLEGAPEELSVVALGSSAKVRQGDWVMSLGNPFEFHQSLSVGLITFVGRHLPEAGVYVTSEYFQFSAPVNPGESGAPLFDMDGRVIGVTRRTLAAGRGISFAVPSKTVKALLRAVQRGESQVHRGYLGIGFRAPSRPESLRGLVVDGGGAEVIRLIPGHPADVAGVQVGDVILNYDGEAVESAADLFERITLSRPGTTVPVSVLREGAVIPPLVVRVSEVGKSSVD